MVGARYSRIIFSVLLLFSIFMFSLDLFQEEKKTTRSLKPGEEGRGPWWMKQTALTADGRFPNLKNRKWWKQVGQLRPGESLMIEESGEARDRMAVRIESYELRSGESLEVLVWILDDDGDGSLKQGGDFHDDCYIYDFNRDGLVDLMVDYIDEDGDGQADSMEVRYFERGYLAKAWIGYDFEGIGEIIKFQTPLDLLSENFQQNLSGDKLHFKNVFVAPQKNWRPAEDGLVASLDLNKDGLSDLLYRFNLASSSTELHFNSLEVSLDVDRGNNLERPYHYELGLIVEGRLPFNPDKFKLYSSQRRPPQEVYTIPFELIQSEADRFKTSRATLSWKEFSDQNLATDSCLAALEAQGLGWGWERRNILSTSRNVQKWNVRREVASTLKDGLEFYYSDCDQKIHLFGAEEGWLPVGNLAGWPRIGEIRYFDTDGNGYFDRREIYLTNSTRPVLVFQLEKEKAKKISSDFQEISDFYLNEVVQASLTRTETIIKAMKEIYQYDQPPGFESILGRVGPAERSYLLEVYCLLYFINLRDHFLTLVNQKLFAELPRDKYGRPAGDLQPELLPNPRQIAASINSEKAWQLARLLTELEMAYGQNDVDKLVEIIRKIKALKI
jgi:hypothetical protein